VEDLHAAIAGYLRGRRPATDTERTRQLFDYAEDRFPAPRCLICGRLVDDDGGLFNLTDMQLRRQCAEHHVPF